MTAERNEWKEAMIDECIIANIPWIEEDPRRTIHRLIQWHIEVALDPQVSSAARKLLETQPRSLYQRLVEWLGLGKAARLHCVHDHFYQDKHGTTKCIGCGRPR